MTSMNWRRVHTQQVVLFVAGSLCGSLALTAPSRLLPFFVTLAMLCLGGALVFGLKSPSVDEPLLRRSPDGPSPFVRTPDEKLRAQRLAEAAARAMNTKTSSARGASPLASPQGMPAPARGALSSPPPPSGGPVPRRYQQITATAKLNLPTK